jgi:hypothetical protein
VQRSGSFRIGGEGHQRPDPAAGMIISLAQWHWSRGLVLVRGMLTDQGRSVPADHHSLLANARRPLGDWADDAGLGHDARTGSCRSTFARGPRTSCCSSRAPLPRLPSRHRLGRPEAWRGAIAWILAGACAVPEMRRRSRRGLPSREQAHHLLARRPLISTCGAGWRRTRSGPNGPVRGSRLRTDPERRVPAAHRESVRNLRNQQEVKNETFVTCFVGPRCVDIRLPRIQQHGVCGSFRGLGSFALCSRLRLLRDGLREHASLLRSTTRAVRGWRRIFPGSTSSRDAAGPA